MVNADWIKDWHGEKIVTVIDIYNVPVPEKYSNVRPSEVDYIKKNTLFGSPKSLRRGYTLRRRRSPKIGLALVHTLFTVLECLLLNTAKKSNLNPLKKFQTLKKYRCPNKFVKLTDQDSEFDCISIMSFIRTYVFVEIMKFLKSPKQPSSELVKPI